jgi:hypothetical protein
VLTSSSLFGCDTCITLPSLGPDIPEKLYKIANVLGMVPSLVTVRLELLDRMTAGEHEVVVVTHGFLLDLVGYMRVSQSAGWISLNLGRVGLTVSSWLRDQAVTV